MLEYAIIVSFGVIQSLVLFLFLCAKPSPVKHKKGKPIQPPRFMVRKRDVNSPDSDEREVQVEYRGSEHTDDVHFPSSLDQSDGRTPEGRLQLKTAEMGEPSTQESRSKAETPTLSTGREEDKHMAKKGMMSWFKKTHQKKPPGKGSKEELKTGLEHSGADRHPRDQKGPKKKTMRVRPLKEANRPTKDNLRTAQTTSMTSPDNSADRKQKRRKSHEPSYRDTSSDCSSNPRRASSCQVKSVEANDRRPG